MKAAENVNKICDLADDPIDTLFNKTYIMTIRGRKRSVKMEVNYTADLVFRMGNLSKWVFENLLDQDKVTKESCMDEDCFHPCYNTEYTMHCPRCWYEINTALSNGKTLEEESERLTQICGKCQVPPEDDRELPGEFREYEPIADTAFKPAKTYEEWKAEKLVDAEDAEEE